MPGTNKPKWVALFDPKYPFGAPDYILSKKNIPLGHIEARDQGTFETKSKV
jgi:hypothetical protein